MTEPLKMVDQIASQVSARLHSVGGGGTSDGMDQRVTRLEEQMVGVREDLRDIKQALSVLPSLPTRRDLQTFALTGIGLALAVIAIVIGGLSWLETRAARVSPPAAAAPALSPVVVQLPAPAAPSSGHPGGVEREGPANPHAESR